jgi:hypothetical protein
MSEARLHFAKKLLFHRRFVRPRRIVGISVHVGDFCFG